jgi:magnesium transporter
MNIIKTKQISWIDIKNPSKKDLNYLKKEFDFHPITLGELLLPTLRPKVEHYDHYLYMVVHFPIYEPKTQTTQSIEIDFLITQNTLITVHYEELPSLKEFWGKCQVDKAAREHKLGETTAFLLYCILESLYAFSLRQLDHITKKIDQIEDKMFKERGSENIVEKISLARRDILDFRKTIKPQKTILDSLKSRGVEFFGKKMRPYFVDIIGDYMRVWNILENHIETIRALRETNDSLVSNRTNRIMRILTVFAVIVFPLTLLASIFGMNTQYLPFVGHEYDFWIIFGFMLVATFAMLVFFKRKKWI